MVKQNGKKNQQPRTVASRIGFLTRLDRVYQMVDDPSTNSIISWSQSGKSFIVWDPAEFSRNLLEKIFRNHDFASFVQKLNYFGIRKVDSSENWEFADVEFLKGEPERVGNIYRRLSSDSDSDSDAEPSVRTMKTVLMKKKMKLRVKNKQAPKAVADKLQDLRI